MVVVLLGRVDLRVAHRLDHVYDRYGERSKWRDGALALIDLSRVAQTIVEYLQASSAQMAVAQIRVLGGAMARVPTEATAFAHRSSRIMVNVAALYERPDEAAVHEDWVTTFAAALRQGEGAAYVNFLGDEGEGRIREAYPGSAWERLAAIKGRYDPSNLFWLNQNIRPTAQN